jgi:glycosyltransferase involved in cell wall biosynthesis
LKILLIHDFYQHFGGEDQAVQADLALLRRGGLNVEVYSRHNDELKSYSIVRKALFPLDTIHSSQTMRDLAEVALRFKPDVAYLHNLYPLISPSIYEALERLGVPAVQTLHDFRPFCSNGWCRTEGEICQRCVTGAHWNAVIHKCVRNSRVVSGIYAATMWRLRSSGALGRVAAFICPTEFLRGKAQAAGIPSEKLFVRPHFIDLREFPLKSSPEDHALYMGRLSEEKGVRTLLEAFCLAPHIPLVIAGSGPLEAELRRYVSERGMKNVRFAGFCSGREKTDLLQRASFVVVPSEAWETFGIVILEAYAMGKSVIGSDLGAIPNMVKDGQTGLLFRSGSAANLAGKVELLSQVPALARRMGFAGRRLVESEYDAGPALDRLMNIFGNVTGNPLARAVHV